jgi:hypothetical protein
MTLEPELRRASDVLLDKLERLRALEEEKRTLVPGSERFVRLSEEIDDLARDILDVTGRQEDLGREARQLVRQGVPPPPPIEEIEPLRDPQTILTEWRDVERRLADTEPGSPEHDELRDQVERLRAEYRRSFEARRSS